MAHSYSSSLHLGIDLGTGSLKLAAYCTLADQVGDGERGGNSSHPLRSPLAQVFSGRRFSASSAYPIVSPSPGIAETDPEAWIGALRSAWQDVRTQIVGAGLVPKLESIGISGQMHGFVPLGRDGRALHNAILWADLRGAEYVNIYARLLSGSFDRLLNAPAAGLSALILLWMKHHEPELYHNTHFILFPKDYLRYRLTGGIATDAGDASASLLWDFMAHSWSGNALDRLGLDSAKLPPVLDSFDVAGFVTASASRETGLPEGVPVAVGSADKACELYGSGFFYEYFSCSTDKTTHSAPAARGTSPGSSPVRPLIQSQKSAHDSDWATPHIAQVSIGTGIQVVIPVRGVPPYSPSLNFFATCVMGLGYRMAAMLNGGLALEWVRTTLQSSWAEFYADLERGRSELPRDLIFLPYLSGERSPYQNPNARGAWIGLGLHHTKSDMLKAALLGVACSIRLGIETLQIAPGAAIYCVGGSTRYRSWMNIVSAVTGRRLLVSPAPDASVRGAAALGAAASWSHITEAAPPFHSPLVPESRRAIVAEAMPAPLESSPVESEQPEWIGEYFDRFLKYYGALFGGEDRP
jgi:xylulokinase